MSLIFLSIASRKAGANLIQDLTSCQVKIALNRCYIVAERYKLDSLSDNISRALAFTTTRSQHRDRCESWLGCKATGYKVFFSFQWLLKSTKNINELSFPGEIFTIRFMREKQREKVKLNINFRTNDKCEQIYSIWENKFQDVFGEGEIIPLNQGGQLSRRYDLYRENLFFKSS